MDIDLSILYSLYFRCVPICFLFPDKLSLSADYLPTISCMRLKRSRHPKKYSIHGVTDPFIRDLIIEIEFYISISCCKMDFVISVIINLIFNTQTLYDIATCAMHKTCSAAYLNAIRYQMHFVTMKNV